METIHSLSSEFNIDPLLGVRRALRNWIEDPPAQDPYIRAHARAVEEDFAVHGPLYDFLSTGPWHEGFRWILDNDYRAAQFLVDVWGRPLQSNKSERYKGLKAFAVLARNMGRLSMVSILDIGCSQNAGLNHMASGVSFESPAVIMPGTRKGSLSLQHMARLDTILHTDFPLDYAVGIDTTHPADSREWAWACSHYPSELLDTRRVELFNALILSQYDNVGFYRGDFVDFDDEDFRQKQADRQFNIVNFSTVLYQASEAEREIMLDRARHYAQEFVVVQDFLKIDPNNPRRLVFRDNWQDEPYPYRMVVQDMRDPYLHWHEIFLWRDGRCNEMAIGLGRLAVAQTMNDVRRTASIWKTLDDIG